MNTPPSGLDDLDLKIIDFLSKDARISNRKIAAEFGVTEGTIRGRIRRLEDDGLIRFTAVTNMSSAEGLQLGFIGIDAEHGRVWELSEKLKEIPEINAVLVLLGRFDLLAIGLFRNQSEFYTIADERILPIPGVRHIETTAVVDTLKYNYRMAKIT